MNVVFIRENAVFFSIGGSQKYPNTFELAKKIDHDILYDSKFSSTADEIIVPKIDSVVSTKYELTKGDSAKITVYASDPDNVPLEYFSFLTRQKKETIRI
ncbi:MAG: hypothetical protein HC906_06490 [Bacteroidales bacterium]|nr:hypothetical protein [Bacteroidales bacterium]